MPQEAPTPIYTWETYRQLDEQADHRYEYHDGTIVDMASATNRHNEIAGNCYAMLRSAALAQGCKSYAMEVRLFRYQSDRYLYPDGMVTCHPLDLQAKNGVRAPLLIVEVLSESSEVADRGFKLREYIRIPSLRHYLLIGQTHCEVQHFSRSSGDAPWQMCFYEDPADSIFIPELDLHLALADLYLGIDFGPESHEIAEEQAYYGPAV
ncbi:MAG: Uma2 family endonuclease [Bacteroidia bacterium]